MLTTIVCVSFISVVCSYGTEIAMTPEPVGSGARALGQSAFIAVADDATAASWNPAGLIQLERPEASFVGAWRTITKDYSSASPLVASMDQDSWNEAQINFMSYARPVEIWNKDMVISVNYHQVYDFGVEYNGVIEEPDITTTIEGESEGSISAYSLAGGLSVPSHPEITIGASINWYAESLLNEHAWKVKQSEDINLPFPFPDGWSRATDTFNDFRGHNFTFGLLWDVYERQENLLTLGLVYHTPFTAKLDRTRIELTSSATGEIIKQQEMEIDFPATLGAGLNYRISDTLSVAFDVERKEWSKFEQKYDNGTSDSPYDDDTVAYRLGAEQLIFLGDVSESVLACRGGLFYEPRPVSDYPDPLKIYGLSAGFGWTVKDQFSLDFAYQYRWGDQGSGIIDYDYREHLFIGSLIFYF